MATVSDLKDQVAVISDLMRRLVQTRQIRDPLAHLHPDLTGPQIHVVACLAVAGKPMPMAELGHRICASAPTMTGVIDRLERQGLVSRERDDADRRVVLIALTASGHTAFRTLEEDAGVKITRLLSCLSSDERETFVRLIGRIVDALATKGDPATDTSEP
jgi:DNA-binding MarR family transcriptional regulator